MSIADERFPDRSRRSQRSLRVQLRLLTTLLVCSPASVSGQATETLPRAAGLPASTRAMALGDAFQTASGHADAVFYHPALLNGASGFGLAWQRWSAESSAASASAAVEWLGGGVGLGLRAFQYSDEPLTGFPFPAPPREGQDDLFDVGSRPVSERIASLGFARELPWLEIDLGVVAELVDERVGTLQHTVLLFDLGVARTVGPLTVALTAHDLGEKPVVSVGDEPSRWTLGVGGYGRDVGPLDLGLAAQVGLDPDDEVTWGGGLELGYWPIQGRTFVARVGVQDAPDDSDVSHFTTGFAFWGDDLTVEWAFRPLRGVDEGGTHRFGVRFR